MFTIKFEANVLNGAVKIPDEYRRLENKHAKIVLMVEDEPPPEQHVHELNFTHTDIKAFSGRDALEIQKDMRDEW